MTILQALILGIVQGITEWLPVSSTAHLILVPWALGWWDPARIPESARDAHFAFDILIQDGTLLAAVIYFRRDISAILRAVLAGLRARRPLGTPEARLGWWLAIGTVPGVAAALLLKDWVRDLHGRPLVVTWVLLGATSLLFLGEHLGRRHRTTADLEARDAVAIGAAQALAIVPGVSRSAATICGGLLAGLGRADAARFSFLLSIPILAGAGAQETLSLWRMPSAARHLPVLAAGFAAAAVVGYATIHWFLGHMARRTLTAFAWYRVAAAVALFALCALRS
jgi:undecaprenyl-diphosphatase